MWLRQRREKVLGAEQFTELGGKVFAWVTHLDAEVMLNVMTKCAGEFNTETDVLKYQRVISVLQIIKIGLWDRQLLQTGWPGKASLGR